MFDSTVVTGTIYTDDTGLAIEVPVVLTYNGALDLLIDYFIEHWGIRSIAWMKKVTASVRLFLSYIDSNSDFSNSREVFQSFRRRLLTGTVSTKTVDLTGLWWSAQGPEKCGRIIRHLTDLFKWWHDKNSCSKLESRWTWTGSNHDERLKRAAFEYRRNQAMLGHTWSSYEEAAKVDRISTRTAWIQAPRTEKDAPSAFPEERILDLVLKGFRTGSRYNYRDMLITLLLNGAGFRKSEPFHLFMWDVTEDPCHKGQALVLIHHPAWGSAPNDSTWLTVDGRQRQGNRTQYLAERYGLVPRNWLLSGKAHAGWKGGMHESQWGGYYKQAYWFVPEFGQLFWQFWNIYVEQVQRIDPMSRNHPYAFVNLHQNQNPGDMYKMGKFEESHSEAVQRIGLQSTKQLGTNIHGHRFAYAQRLRKAAIPEEMIRRFMHHISPQSQAVYTAPSNAECYREINAAVERLDSAASAARAQLARAALHELNSNFEGE